MKKTFFLLINILTMLYCYSQCPKYFSYPHYNQVYDYKNDINLDRIDNYEKISNKHLVERISITVIKNDEHQFFESYFENGLVYKEIFHIHDLNIQEKKYDD